MQDILNWEVVWQELRDNLLRQPRCPDHSQCPHIMTLSLGVINDIIKVQENGIIVRSHESRRNIERFIGFSLFKKWWDYLLAKKSASLIPGHPNNPERWNSRIVGEIIATCLLDKIRVINHNTIELIQWSR